jgi:hypothetical protein
MKEKKKNETKDWAPRFSCVFSTIVYLFYHKTCIKLCWQFYGRHHDLVNRYGITVSEMTTTICFVYNLNLLSELFMRRTRILYTSYIKRISKAGVWLRSVDHWTTVIPYYVLQWPCVCMQENKTFNKMHNKKHNVINTFPKSNKKIVETDAKSIQLAHAYLNLPTWYSHFDKRWRGYIKIYKNNMFCL